MVIETEVTDLVVDRRLAVHIRSSMHESDDRYDLEPVGSGSRLAYASRHATEGPDAALVDCDFTEPPRPCQA